MLRTFVIALFLLSSFYKEFDCSQSTDASTLKTAPGVYHPSYVYAGDLELALQRPHRGATAPQIWGQGCWKILQRVTTLWLENMEDQLSFVMTVDSTRHRLCQLQSALTLSGQVAHHWSQSTDLPV